MNKRKHSDDEEEQTETDEGNQSQIIEDGGYIVDGIYIPPPLAEVAEVDVNGPRLMISKIINTNFKSYGESQILGPFHKNFNAIVGSNGSGKSNVIDALLFVFGYRASKIRSKKLSVLIHKSVKYPDLPFCSVAVHFSKIIDKEDNPLGYEVVEGSEFSISRTAHKDNTSYYQVDDKRVQYRDLAVLLRRHGIDLDHNRFLILQGEVEQISLMKPVGKLENETGMLEYLEDIIGSRRYKEPLDKLEDKIEILTEQRSEKLNRVRMAENEKDSLKKPMQDAIDYLELQNETALKKNYFYQQTIHLINEELQSEILKETEIVELHNKVKEKLSMITEKKQKFTETCSEFNKKMEELNKSKESLTDTFEKVNRCDVALQADLVQCNKRRKQIIEILKQEKVKLENYENAPEKCKQEIKEYEERETDLQSKVERLTKDRNKILITIGEETSGLKDEKEKLQTKLVDLRKIVDEKKSQYNITESELKIYVSNEETEKNKLEVIRANVEENKQKLTDFTKHVKELKQKIPLTEKSFGEARSELERVKLDEANCIQEIKMKRMKIEERRCMMQASKSRNRVLDSLMRQKTEGNLPGLFGRLGDLGAIDKKYDVAVSTACGPLDNIVVDTVDTAQWCIEFLKTHDIGRATFIALEKQEHLRQATTMPIQTPENVPRLFDLIRVDDERVSTAFYFALRDTLVANDIDQASRIAYGARRYRVVTLKGELIELSGTMSGGGRTVLQGRMGQSVTVQSRESTSENMESLESNLNELEQSCRNLRQRQLTLEDQVNTLQTQLKQMKTDLQKYSTELQSLQTQRPVLQEQLQKQEHKAKTTSANPAQVKKLKDKMETQKLEFESANEKSNELETKVNKINSEIKAKTDKKLKGITKEIADSSKMLETCKAELVKFRVAIKTAERNIKKTKEKLANLEQEKTESETSLIAMQAERTTIEKDAALILEKLEKIANEICQVEEENSEINEKLNSLNTKMNNVKSEKIEIDQKLKEIKTSLHDRRTEICDLQKKISLLTMQEVPQKTIGELKTFESEKLNKEALRLHAAEVAGLEERLKVIPNLSSIKEYEQKEAVYLERVQELDVVTENRNKIKAILEDLRKKRREEFYAGFLIIAYKLKEMYQMITLGGDADLELVDSYDPFNEGVVLNVRPPKKSWKNLTNLSGGEKTLTSLALVFALHYYKPSPLYFMDEIDAALDFKNVSIVGHYIKERTKNSQFIIISLRSNMFELADHLIGIYKTNDVTKSLTIQLNNETIPSTQKNNMLNGVMNGEHLVNGHSENDVDNHDIPTTSGHRNNASFDELVNGSANEDAMNGNSLIIDDSLQMDTSE